MLTAKDFEPALLEALPGASAQQIEKIARVLAAVSAGTPLKRATESSVAAADPEFAQTLRDLDGHVISAGAMRFVFKRSEEGISLKVESVAAESGEPTGRPSPVDTAQPHISVSGSHNVAAWHITDSVVIAGNVILEQPLPIFPTADEIEAARRRLAEMPTESSPPVSAPVAGSRMKFARNPFFVGREDELLKLARMLKGVTTQHPDEVLTAALTGFVGVGKTQLAVEFVHRFGTYFAGGVFWLNFSKADAVKGEVAACGRLGALNLGRNFAQLTVEEQALAVKSVWATSMPRLLVFDNCESEELLKEWRPESGGCRVLVTSRRDNWPVILGVQNLPLDVLTPSESVELLTRYRPDLNAESSVLKGIATHLGHLPLALHLAGCYMEVTRFDISPGDYLELLLRAPPVFRQASMQRGFVSLTGYELTLAQVFELCYSLLNPANQVDQLALIILARAAHFAPGHFIPRRLLIETLANWQREGSERKWISDAVARLDSVGVLQQHSGGDLRMHLLLAEFVNEVTNERVEAEAREAVEKVLAWAAVMPEDAGYVDTLYPLQTHLHAVFHESSKRALKSGDYDAAAQKLLPISKYLLSWGGYQDSIDLFETVVDQLSRPKDVIKVLIHLGTIYRNTGAQSRAVEVLRRAREMARANGFRADEAIILNQIGNQHFDAGRIADALEHYEQALSSASAFDERERTLEAKLRISKAKCHYNLGETERAVFELDRAFGFVSQIGNPDRAKELELLFYSTRAQCDFVRGDVAAAIKRTERALSIAEVTGDARSRIFCLNNLGDFCTAAGAYQEAHEHLQKALEKCREFILPRAEGHILHTLAELLINEGKLTEAIEQAGAGARVSRQNETPQAAADNESARARAHLFAGELPAAKDAIEAALAGALEVDQHYVLGLAGVIELKGGQHDAAAEYFTEADQRAATLITRDAKNARAHYTRGLALAALSHCGEDDHFEVAMAAYTRALALAGAAGVVARERQLLELLVPLDETRRLSNLQQLFKPTPRPTP